MSGLNQREGLRKSKSSGRVSESVYMCTAVTYMLCAYAHQGYRGGSPISRMRERRGLKKRRALRAAKILLINYSRRLFCATFPFVCSFYFYRHGPGERASESVVVVAVS